MPTVNMLEAKSTLSRLVQALEDGTESEIIIARNGKPVARLTSLAKKPVAPRRLGLFEGKYRVMSQEEFDADNDYIAALFRGEAD